jgi:hypothetical protein
VLVIRVEARKVLEMVDVFVYDQPAEEIQVEVVLYHIAVRKFNSEFLF